MGDKQTVQKSSFEKKIREKFFTKKFSRANFVIILILHVKLSNRYPIVRKKRNVFFILPYCSNTGWNPAPRKILKVGINPAPRKILKSGDGGDQIGDQIRSNLTRFDRMSNRAVECETVRFDRSVPFGVISTIYPQTGRTNQIYENRIKSASNSNHIE